MAGIYTAFCGVVMIVWVWWYLPRKMQQIRQKVVERGRSPKRLDAQMESRLWRILASGSLPFGIFAIVAGLALFITE
jgi:uncharacterized membrane protein